MQNKKKSSLQDLIENISNETDQNLDNLVKNVQDQNHQKQQRKQLAIKKVQMKIEKMNEFENSSSKEGQKFWFPESEKPKRKKSIKQTKKELNKDATSQPTN